MGSADYQTREYALTAYSTSVGGSPQTTYIPVPWDAVLHSSRVAIGAAITVANSVITVSVLPLGVAANAITIGGTITIVQAGSAAGMVFMTLHSSPQSVHKGDVIRLVPAGATTTSVGIYTLKFRR